MPKIITEDFDAKMSTSPSNEMLKKDMNCFTESSSNCNENERKRSLSGPSHPVQPTRHSGLSMISASYRYRRQSGGDELQKSPQRQTKMMTPPPQSQSSIPEQGFRPRSKSDGKSHKKSMISNWKNNLFGNHDNSNANSNSNNNQMQSPGYLDPYYQEKMNESKMNEPANQRNRSGSGGSGGPMSRVIDMFRGRSHSIAEGSPTSKIPSNKVR